MWGRAQGDQVSPGAQGEQLSLLMKVLITARDCTATFQMLGAKAASVQPSRFCLHLHLHLPGISFLSSQATERRF